MASVLARTAMRATSVRQTAAPVALARRSMSGSKEHAIEEMIKWKRITMGMLAGCMLTGIVVYIGEEEHSHPDPDEVQPTYRNIRTVPFPWWCNDCAFIDKECFKKCREERGGSVIPSS